MTRILRDGDRIHVVDRQGDEWVYAYREQRVVTPGDVWVVGDDPLGSGMFPWVERQLEDPTLGAATAVDRSGQWVRTPR